MHVFRSCSFRNNRHNILVSYDMTQPNPLGNVTCTGSPHHGILECVFQRPMYLVTNFFDRRFVPYDQSFTKVGVFSLPLLLLAWDCLTTCVASSTVWYRSSSTVALASTSLLRPEFQDRAHSSSPPYGVLWPACRESQVRPNRSCCTHIDFDTG